MNSNNKYKRNRETVLSLSYMNRSKLSQTFDVNVTLFHSIYFQFIAHDLSFHFSYIYFVFIFHIYIFCVHFSYSFFIYIFCIHFSYIYIFCIHFSYIGTTAGINKEMDEQIFLKTALAKFKGTVIHSTGTTTVNDVQMNSEYPLVSAITMMAPSPDWFIGVHNYSLCNETTGKWIDKRVQYLFPYDAGTDSAPRFVHNDIPTIPQVPIFLITNTQEGSFKSNNPIKRLGTFTFVKTSESNPELSSIAKKNKKPTSSLAALTAIPFSTAVPIAQKGMSSNRTEGNLKPAITASNATFSVIPSAVTVKTTMKTSSNAKKSKASFYLSIFVSFKLMIFNLFFH